MAIKDFPQSSSIQVVKKTRFSPSTEALARKLYGELDEGKFVEFEKGAFFVRIESEQTPPSVSIRNDISYDTAMFKFQPIGNDADRTNIVGWIVRPKFPDGLSEITYGDCFVSSVRRKMDPAIFAPLDHVATSASSVEECQKAMSAVFKTHKLPIPRIQAVLHGLIVLETGDTAGLVILSSVPDFSL